MSADRPDPDNIEEIREIFSHFDKNGDGVIERNEFATLLAALDASVEPEEIQAGLDALDDNRNGLIDFDEFVDWWSNR